MHEVVGELNCIIYLCESFVDFYMKYTNFIHVQLNIEMHGFYYP